MAAWSPTSDSNFNKTCQVQNQNLRIMTEALKSTPINDMETIIGLESMGDRREVKQVIQLEKMKRLQYHSMRERVSTGTKSRLKRLSFLHKARKSTQDLEIPAQDRPEPMNTTYGTSESHAIPTALFSSNYRAEIAASILKNHSETSKYRVVLLTDAKSVLQALTSAKCPLTEQLLAALCQLHSIALTVVQWIPGHSNIPGNDQADSLAKEGAKLPQQKMILTYLR